MAEIPRAALDEYTRQVNAVSADAQEKVLRVLERVEWTDENIADCRAIVSEAVRSVCDAYGMAAAQASADFYDAARELSIGEPLGAVPDPGYNPDATDGAIRAFAQDIVDGKPVSIFNSKVLDRVDYEMKRSSAHSIIANAKRDPKKPRWARVPSGGETCPFCLMLASRGFVYRSDESAGSHYHANCDCRIVPGWDGMKVEGYDPDELYDRWKLSLAGSEHPLRKDSNGGSFLRIVGEHSIEDDLAATNPRYNDGPEWRKNCQRCVGAYEMRRRGYDVTALPANLVDGHLDYSDPLPNRFDPNGWPSMFAGAELEKIPGTTANAIRGRIERMMSGFGDESRAIVRVKYKRRYGGGGHVFIAEQVDGSTRFIDPQTGSSDCSSYFSMISSGETEILRVDDKDVTDLIKKAVG